MIINRDIERPGRNNPLTWNFEILESRGGKKLWSAHGFVSEKSREDAIKIALSQIGRKPW